jgi:hypothetical protein
MIFDDFPQIPSVPIIYWKHFATLIGLDEEVVRGMCEKRHLPVVRFGKYRFVNLALLTSQCLQKSSEAE